MGENPKRRRASSSSGSSDAGCTDSLAPGDDTTTAASANGCGPLKVKKRTRKSVPRDSPMQRSSIYRGVTRHRWTGRFEAHLWDKNCWNESQNKKGRQVYLGAYDDEEAAAHAYDLAALKYWGQDTILNFPLPTYEQEVKEMEGQTREEYIGSLRRKSSGFSRGVSKYRGVARHHHNGRWEARIGRVLGNKYLYLGTYATQEEAAMAYDMAAIEYRGLNAVTNFDLSRYIKWLRPDPSCDATAAPAVAVEESSLGFPPHHHQEDTRAPFPVVDHNQAVGLVAHHHDMGLDLYTQPHGMGAGGGGRGEPATTTIPIAIAAAAAAAAAVDQAVHPHRGSGGASSALGLLLQSPEYFPGMLLEDDIACAQLEPSLSPPSSSEDNTVDAACAATALCCGFPDDIQTYFECHHDHIISYMEAADDDDIIFGDLADFTSTIFDCELGS